MLAKRGKSVERARGGFCDVSIGTLEKKIGHLPFGALRSISASKKNQRRRRYSHPQAQKGTKRERSAEVGKEKKHHAVIELLKKRGCEGERVVEKKIKVGGRTLYTRIFKWAVLKGGGGIFTEESDRWGGA